MPDLNIKDFRGWYPLHYAVQNNLLKVIGLLVKQGAILEAKDDYGNTPLWRAVFASEGRGEVIKLLLTNWHIQYQIMMLSNFSIEYTNYSYGKYLVF